MFIQEPCYCNFTYLCICFPIPHVILLTVHLRAGGGRKARTEALISSLIFILLSFCKFT